MAKALAALAALAGVALGLYAAWWASGLALHLYSPHATSSDGLFNVGSYTFLGAAAVLCPLLAWAGWRLGLRIRGR